MFTRDIGSFCAAGRGQAIAPTLDALGATEESRGDGLSSPCSLCNTVTGLFKRCCMGRFCMGEARRIVLKLHFAYFW